jgi:hypothetical protein
MMVGGKRAGDGGPSMEDPFKPELRRLGAKVGCINSSAVTEPRGSMRIPGPRPGEDIGGRQWRAINSHARTS